MTKYFSSFAISVDYSNGKISGIAPIQRHLVDLKNHFFDRKVVEEMLSSGLNPLIYEVYEAFQPSEPGHLNFGTTVLNPGKIGEEYFFTKGHHHVRDCGETYSFFKGKGIFLLQTKNGETAEMPLEAGTTIYVPPGWAHRMVNVGKEELISIFCYDAAAGHDYGSIERTGFAKLVVERKDKTQIIGNPFFRRSDKKWTLGEVT